MTKPSKDDQDQIDALLKYLDFESMPARGDDRGRHVPAHPGLPDMDTVDIASLYDRDEDAGVDESYVTNIVNQLLLETPPAMLRAALEVRPDLLRGWERAKTLPRDDFTAYNLGKQIYVEPRAKVDKDSVKAIQARIKDQGQDHDQYIKKIIRILPEFEKYKNWYTESRDAIDRHFKTPVTHYGHFVSGLIAATSPRTSTGLNFIKALRNADDIIMGHKMSHMPGSDIDNSIRAATGTNLSGQKIFSFDNNIRLDDPEYTTADSHHYSSTTNEFLPNDDAVNASRYLRTTGINRHIAKELNWTPRETQAALWAFDIARSGGNHPAFHKPRSPFKEYSKRGRNKGHLDVTDVEPPTHSYAQFLDNPINVPIIKQFTDRWDAKISSNPEELKRVGNGHYMPGPEHFISGHDIRYSDLDNPNLRMILAAPSGTLLPDQTITNPYGEEIKRTANAFDPALHAAVKKHEIRRKYLPKTEESTMEYNKLVLSLIHISEPTRPY